MKKNNVINQLQDTIIHKKLVLDSCYLLSQYLYSSNNQKLALELLKRASYHDVSKFENEELLYLSSIPLNSDAFKNPNIEMTEQEKKLIALHWKHNRHHPEYHENYDDMTELDMLEMVCDWHARSLQFNTNFLKFVKTRQDNRFNFNREQFSYIYKYCKILNKLYKKDIQRK